MTGITQDEGTQNQAENSQMYYFSVLASKGSFAADKDYKQYCTND